jgi:putative ATPase
MLLNDEPLAERQRPKTISDYVGQSHLIGEKGIISQLLKADIFPSIIFWGPPGVGKTTLAELISTTLQRPFFSLSAINSGVKDLREVIDKAREKNLFQPAKPILFIDEIHRFSKSQQDSLLGAVEKGIVTLIGATTENPSFEVINALLSRCQVYTLKALNINELRTIYTKAIANDIFLKNKNILVEEDEALLQLSGGDARKLLNILELLVSHQQGNEIRISNKITLETVKQKPLMYDKKGEFHYDIISAFIKSIRGSDPNAAVYWLARMIAGGEDPKFIARRMLIAAAEDIGNANPNALLMAQTCFNAVSVIGMPEGRIILSQTAIYLACSEKSNASYTAIDEALALVEKTQNLEVPIHLRNAPTQLMKQLNYGKDYAYSHQFEDNFVKQQYLPEAISGHIFYQPGKNQRENSYREKLIKQWKTIYPYTTNE